MTFAPARASRRAPLQLRVLNSRSPKCRAVQQELGAAVEGEADLLAGARLRKETAAQVLQLLTGEQLGDRALVRVQPALKCWSCIQLNRQCPPARTRPCLPTSPVLPTLQEEELRSALHTLPVRVLPPQSWQTVEKAAAQLGAAGFANALSPRWHTIPPFSGTASALPSGSAGWHRATVLLAAWLLGWRTKSSAPLSSEVSPCPAC